MLPLSTSQKLGDEYLNIRKRKWANRSLCNLNLDEILSAFASGSDPRILREVGDLTFTNHLRLL